MHDANDMELLRDYDHQGSEAAFATLVQRHIKDTTYSVGFIGLRIFGDGDYPCDATFSRLTFY